MISVYLSPRGKDSVIIYLTQKQTIMQSKKTPTEKNPTLPQIAQRLRDLLEREKTSVRAFSIRMGWSHTHLGSVLHEKNILSGSMLIKLAEEGYDLNWLLAGRSVGSPAEAPIEADLRYIIKQQRTLIDSLLEMKNHVER